MALVLLVAVTASVFIDQSGSLGKFMENKGLPFLLVWGIGTYFIESYLPVDPLADRTLPALRNPLRLELAHLTSPTFLRYRCI